MLILLFVLAILLAFVYKALFLFLVWVIVLLTTYNDLFQLVAKSAFLISIPVFSLYFILFYLYFISFS